ncbi:MAG: hypothetical protein K0A90_00145 [Methanosarcinaceae archaeon]|nr:hypothetical protein [Methanosarcinaceae archaeon]
MVVTYTTTNKVANMLGFPDGYFDTNSTPTATVIEGLINRAEDRIDSTTSHSWKAKTVTKEYSRPTSVFRSGAGIRIDLVHRSVQSITNIEIWQDGVWVDWVVDKVEGRAYDYWVDKQNGVIFLNGVRRLYPHGVRVTYVFGETTVSGGVEDCATMMVALKILNSPEFSTVLFTQVGESKPNWDSTKNLWKDEIKNILDNNTEFQ